MRMPSRCPALKIIEDAANALRLHCSPDGSRRSLSTSILAGRALPIESRYPLRGMVEGRPLACSCGGVCLAIS